MFLFRMRDATGDDLGDYQAARPDSHPGDVLYHAGLPTWRITAVIPADTLDSDAYDGRLGGRTDLRPLPLARRRALMLPARGTRPPLGSSLPLNALTVWSQATLAWELAND